MTRDDIHVEVTKPDWAYHAENEKMVIIHFPKSARSLIERINDGKYADRFDLYYAEPDNHILSAALIRENMGFTLRDLEDGKSRLEIHVIPTPEGDDILDGSHHQEDLTLTDMMNVVGAVKLFMGLLE